jgi:hypothetical protein
MYVWIWRRLPGGPASKVTGALLLFVVVVAVLYLAVFPWLAPKLPFNHVTVNGSTSTPSALARNGDLAWSLTMPSVTAARSTAR